MKTNWKAIILCWALLLLLCGGLFAEATSHKPQGDPCGSHFCTATYFSDMRITNTAERRELTISETMELLDKLPNVKYVSVACDPPRAFSLTSLAYPQYASRYELTQGEWADLQAYCREQLRMGIGVDKVIAHWRSIVAGTPPFGLRVQPESH